MTDHTQHIKYIWQMVYDLLNGPGRAQTYNSFLHLPPYFESDLLSRIAALRNLSGGELSQKTEEVRAQINIAQAAGLVGSADIERINIELDKLI